MEVFAKIALGSAAIALSSCAFAQAEDAAVPAQATVSCEAKLEGLSLAFPLNITGPEGRVIPASLYTPNEPGTYPLIAFSHGAFSAPDRYTAILKPLAAAGYIVLAPMHIDSEEYALEMGQAAPAERPPHPITWSTRNEDFAAALNPEQSVIDLLAQNDLAIDPERTIALGHSYGALIAQLPGGALAFEPDGSQVDRTDTSVDVVVGWSPPSAMPGLMANEGWASLSAPSLTITGTADVLPGFIDDWQAHKGSYDFAPAGARALWVGEGIDHYFGGMFGREKPAGESDQALFARALATSLHFIEKNTSAPQPCILGETASGETYQED